MPAWLECLSFDGAAALWRATHRGVTHFSRFYVVSQPKSQLNKKKRENRTFLRDVITRHTMFWSASRKEQEKRKRLAVWMKPEPEISLKPEDLKKSSHVQPSSHWYPARASLDKSSTNSFNQPIQAIGLLTSLSLPRLLHIQCSLWIWIRWALNWR